MISNQNEADYEERAGYELVRAPKVEVIEFPQPRPKWCPLQPINDHGDLAFDGSRFQSET